MSTEIHKRHFLQALWHWFCHDRWSIQGCGHCEDDTLEREIERHHQAGYWGNALLPEEEEEVFLCYYHQIFVNGEDEEMFERDKAFGDLPA